MMQVAPAPVQVDPRFLLPRTLVFGIGAQKSATTWLSAYLRDHPQVHLPPRKELHYWNGVRPPYDKFTRAWARRDRLAAQREREARPTFLERISGNRKARRKIDELEIFARMYDDPHRPYNNYADALFLGYRDQPVAVEITPPYSRLREPVFKEMLRLAPDVKFIYLLRDPAKRVVSATRHDLRKKLGDQVVTTADVVNRLQNNLAYPKHRVFENSRYELTISRLEAVVPKDRIFYSFYETLFSDGEIARLCAFLGVSHKQADFKRQENVASDTAARPPNTLMDEIRAVLSPTYGFVKTRFGAIPECWQAASERV